MRLAVTTENTAPTARDLTLVRDSFDKAVPMAGVVADLFYERLFYQAPSLRRMFPADLRDQKRKLMVMLATAVQGLHDLEALVPQVKALGARHAGYGVEPAHYTVVGEALLWTLERGLGNAFTVEVRQAWTRVYALLATTMQAGADDAVTLRAAE